MLLLVLVWLVVSMISCQPYQWYVGCLCVLPLPLLERLASSVQMMRGSNRSRRVFMPLPVVTSCLALTLSTPGGIDKHVGKTLNRPLMSASS